MTGIDDEYDDVPEDDKDLGPRPIVLKSAKPWEDLSPTARQVRWSEHYFRLHGHRQDQPHTDACTPTDDRGRFTRR